MGVMLGLRMRLSATKVANTAAKGKSAKDNAICVFEKKSKKKKKKKKKV
jgi:hypothetical protein